MEAATTTRYPRYSKYKDSGVEWLGEVPTHWTVALMKRLGKIRYGLGEPPPKADDGIPFVRATDISKGKIALEGVQRVDVRQVPWNREPGLIAGDIIVVRSGAYTGDSAIVPERLSGAVAGYDMFFRVRTGVPDFIAWAVLSPYVLEAQLKLASLRAAQPHLNAEELGRTALILPPLPEQRAITAFLDRETARIDALVAKKERLIELLAEKRTALITQAVTKGLDPTVPMKDSGVEWLGEVPAEWEVGPLRRFCRHAAGAIKTGPFGSQLLSSDMNGSDVAVVDQRSVLDNEFRHFKNWITVEKYRDLASFKVEPLDLLVTTRGTIGKCAVAPRGLGLAVLHPCVLRIQLDYGQLTNSYLAYLIEHSIVVSNQLRSLSNSTTIDVIYGGTMGRVAVPVPPVVEQAAIVSYLNHNTAHIDALTDKVHEAIALLKEYRTALISAAVTGKIDVRDAA